MYATMGVWGRISALPLLSPLPGGLPPPPGLPTSAIPLKTAPEFRNRGRYAACDN